MCWIVSRTVAMPDKCWTFPGVTSNAPRPPRNDTPISKARLFTILFMSPISSCALRRSKPFLWRPQSIHWSCSNMGTCNGSLTPTIIGSTVFPRRNRSWLFWFVSLLMPLYQPLFSALVSIILKTSKGKFCVELGFSFKMAVEIGVVLIQTTHFPNVFSFFSKPRWDWDLDVIFSQETNLYNVRLPVERNGSTFLK